MNAKDAIRQVAELSFHTVHAYLDDLTDADLFVRSVPGANHIAWQLGHLIVSTGSLLSAVGQAGPELPPGFGEAHTSENVSSDDRARFASKATYLELVERAKAALLAALEAVPDAALDQPGPERMRDYAPTVGAVLVLTATHWMMHAGQFVPVRRALGRPMVI